MANNCKQCSIRIISHTTTPLPKAYDCVAVYIAGRRTSLVVYGWWPQPPTKKDYYLTTAKHSKVWLECMDLGVYCMRSWMPTMMTSSNGNIFRVTGPFIFCYHILLRSPLFTKMLSHATSWCRSIGSSTINRGLSWNKWLLTLNVSLSPVLEILILMLLLFKCMFDQIRLMIRKVAKPSKRDNVCVFQINWNLLWNWKDNLRKISFHNRGAFSFNIDDVTHRRTVQHIWGLVAVCPQALTHWGRMTHICVSKLTITGSDNGLSPERHQAIIWTNAEILLIGPLGTNFSEIFYRNSNIFIEEKTFENVVCEMLFISSRPQCVYWRSSMPHPICALMQDCSISSLVLSCWYTYVYPLVGGLPLLFMVITEAIRMAWNKNIPAAVHTLKPCCT